MFKLLCIGFVATSIASCFLIPVVHAQISPGQNTMSQMAPPPKADVSPGASVIPAVSVASPLGADEKKTLLKEFKRALSNEEKALSHREKSELKQFSNSQNSKTKNWRETEKAARRKYFDQHLSGPERRDYVKSYLKKKEAFDRSLVEETNVNKKEWKERHDQLISSQKEREIQFQKSLDQNVRPDASVWSKGN